LAPLHDLVKKNDLKLMVACNFRFHPAFDLILRKLGSGELGRPLTANAAIGYDIRSARPGMDYRKTYAASRMSGGGALYDSGAHVVDYLLKLFGTPKSGHAYCKNVILDIKAEDFAQFELEFDNNVQATATLDYFSLPKRDHLEIQCTKGAIFWDVFRHTITLTDQKGKTRMKQYYVGMENAAARNDMFIREVRYFMDTINKKKASASDLMHAEKVQRTLAMLLLSDKTGKRITFSSFAI
jgi:predicted dehydrogenase